MTSSFRAPIELNINCDERSTESKAILTSEVPDRSVEKRPSVSTMSSKNYSFLLIGLVHIQNPRVQGLTVLPVVNESILVSLRENWILFYLPESKLAKKLLPDLQGPTTKDIDTFASPKVCIHSIDC